MRVSLLKKSKHPDTVLYHSFLVLFCELPSTDNLSPETGGTHYARSTKCDVIEV